jgi:hypothetical protein
VRKVKRGKACAVPGECRHRKKQQPGGAQEWDAG